MKGLIQRVSMASVSVAGNTVGQINKGLLLLLGVEKDDDEGKAQRLCEKVINYRVFADEQGKMNLSLKQVQGQLLVVSQFTLVADTAKGTRPSFSSAADPGLSQRLYDYFIQQVKSHHVVCASGQFGADMQVSLVNDGPVTFLLKV